MRKRMLYLVRHGALITGRRRIFVGQLDLPLSRLGRLQANALRDYCRGIPIKEIYCSDLARSRETAQIIAADRNVKITEHPQLREISLGKWQGKAISDIARRSPLEFDARGADIEHYRPSEGESFADCRARVLMALDGILRVSTEDLLIVAHAGVNRVILCEALGIPIANVLRIPQEFGCLNILELGSAGYRLKLMNFVPDVRGQAVSRHLQQEAVTAS